MNSAFSIKPNKTLQAKRDSSVPALSLRSVAVKFA